MSPLVKKEIRLLLPAWIVAMLLAIASFLLTIGNVGTALPDTPGDLHIFFLLLAATLLGIASFGQEFNSGTFTLLLSQPIERHRIWTIKTTLLALAYASVCLTLLVSWELHLFHLHFNWRVLWTILKYVGLSALCSFVFFSGGLCTTLLLRRISEAFWLTFLTPVILMAMVYAISEFFHWPDQVNNYFVPAVFLMYSLAGFFWARRFFLSAQDVQWTGGVIAFSSRKRNSERTQVLGRPRNWFFALVRKELQLQQVNILIAAVVLILHLASVTVRRIHPVFGNPNIGLLLEFIWMLWLAMPLLIGSAAVAEERRIGVTESQFCLPVSRRAQFAIKFFVALILSLVLGGLAPCAIERAYELNYYIFVVAAVIFFVSFYASTLARTTLQALGLTLVLFPVVYLYLIAEDIAITRFGDSYTLEELGMILLKFHLGLPVLMLVLTCLTFGNFKWLHPDTKLWWRNGFAFLAALASVSLLIHAIYFRVWEFLTPVPSPDGPARLSALHPPKLGLSGDSFSMVLPDGRLWIETYDNYGEWDAPKQGKAQFIGGSNWLAAASGWGNILAIQSNGSLWFIPEEIILQENGWYSQTGRPAQVGSGTNWLGVASGGLGGSGFWLLNGNGTLWNWGTNWASTISKMQALNLATPPVEIGNATNWTEVFNLGWYACAKRDDGSLWPWKPTGTNSLYYLVRETNFVVGTYGFSMGNRSWQAGIKANGELWLSWTQWTNNQSVFLGKIQLGQDAKWKAVEFANNSLSLLALRSDGTLWRWTRFWDIANRPNSVKPSQVGNYSGWIGLVNPHAITLAADGSVWAWGESSRHAWLSPPRKPVYLGNIFEKSD